MNLKDLGWKSKLSNEEAKAIARITNKQRGLCRGMTLDGEINIYLSGKFRRKVLSGKDKPATGDFVRFGPVYTDEQNFNAATLKEIIPRSSKIARVSSGHVFDEQVIVANVDLAFIVTSANDEFNLNRLQRYILLAKDGNVAPIIVLSKTDLIEDSEHFVSQIKNRFEGIEIIQVSSVKNVGIEKIREKLSVGFTAVFLGSSGVGKSTIVNKLLCEQRQATKEIRQLDSKGRHTTSTRELFFLPSGGMVIDTAGLREVQILSAKEDVSTIYREIGEISQNCRFSNCAHDKEPGCAINDALKNGLLNEAKYNNYKKLQIEASLAAKKIKQSKETGTKERWRTSNKNIKARRKFEEED